MNFCGGYVGIACVDGSCPKANAEEYAERGMDITKKCSDCFYYKGCEDCGLAGTEHCVKALDKVSLITIQNKAVTFILDKYGIYYSGKEPADNLKAPYGRMKAEYGYEHNPIFAGVVGQKCEFMGAKTDGSVLICLEVPAIEVKFQNYYEWSDLVYFMECPDEWNGDISFDEYVKNTLHKPNLGQHNAWQATLSCIKKEWVTGVYDIPETFISRHIGSGGANILQKIGKQSQPVKYQACTIPENAHRYVVMRMGEVIDVLLMQNKNDKTWSFINMSKGHICSCRFATVEDAEADMERHKNDKRIIDYVKVM